MAFLKCFNPRPCTRGDQGPRLLSSPRQLFQSTPLYEGRLCAVDCDDKDYQFQSTPLYEGRLPEASRTMTDRVFQSTPLYEGRLMFRSPVHSRVSVSIHAPVRGATYGVGVMVLR